VLASLAVELKELRSLVALSELGSISLVAERLHLSPPAIHKQLKTLEGELGVLLYEKVGKRLQLAQAASVLLPHVKELLVQYDSALSALEEWKGLKRGLVRVGAGPTGYVLPSILKRFEQAHPGIEVQVETGNTPVLMEDLHNGLLDLALIVSTDLSERHDFHIEAVWDFELVLVSRMDKPMPQLRLHDFDDQRFILFRQRSRLQEPIDRYFARHQFEPKVVMRFDNANFIRDMVLSGLGVAFLPLWVVDRDMKEGNLRVIRLAEAAPSSKLALIRRKTNYVPRPVQGFIETSIRLSFSDLPLLGTSRRSQQFARQRSQG
jgi:LysR family transcriptional regulator, transcriptional activator of the cysJI operon